MVLPQKNIKYFKKTRLPTIYKLLVLLTFSKLYKVYIETPPIVSFGRHLCSKLDFYTKVNGCSK